MLNIKDKEKFLQFALDASQTATEDGKFFKTNQNDIIYIMYGDFANEKILNDYYNKAEICGFVYNGKFYGSHYDTRDIDLNLKNELNKFEDRFNSAYDESIKKYNIDNLVPITENVKKSNIRVGDFEYYCKHQAAEDAKRELFEISYKNEKKYNNACFASRFFDCLKHPENFAKYVQLAIEENAHYINHRIKCNTEKEKSINELKKNGKLMHSIKMYKALKALDAKTVKLSCKLYNEDFELKCDREALMRDIAFNNSISLWNFTSTIADKIKDAAAKSGLHRNSANIYVSDIQKITYGKKIIFEEVLSND